MNVLLLKDEIQNFIKNNTETNITKLALQKNPFPEVPWVEILNQLYSKTKAKTKLPTWYKQHSIVYPSKISIEQTSSEITANYKSELIFGEKLIDLTGGFGVDDFYFAKKFKTVFHCELDKDLSKIVTHNFKILNKENIVCLNGDSDLILKNRNEYYDWIYIDPSRRNINKGKVFQLKDCMPNVPKNLDLYFEYSKNILIKTAPLLDISIGINELKYVKEIHIIAINNEVKELLWMLEENYFGSINIKTIHFKKGEKESFDFNLEDEITTKCYSLPQEYIYEPNAAILKSGGFNQIAKKFNLNKLDLHSHLYTSKEHKKFPGRIFKVISTFIYSKKEMMQLLYNSKANITTRNFPEDVEKIRKKWKIKDGGELYVFFTTNLYKKKIVIICKKINN